MFWNRKKLEPNCFEEVRPYVPKGADSTRTRMFRDASLLIDSTGVRKQIDKAAKRLDNSTVIWSDWYPEDFERICKALRLLGFNTKKNYSNKNYKLDIRW